MLAAAFHQRLSVTIPSGAPNRSDMFGLRLWLVRHPALAAAVLVAALALRVAVPAGFMPLFDHGRAVIAICSGSGPSTLSIAMPGMAHQPEDGTAKSRCAFADLALPAISGTDPIQLAEVLLHILALGLLFAAAIPLRTLPRLTPPATGPPARA